MYYVIILPNGDHYSTTLGAVKFDSPITARECIFELAKKNRLDPPYRYTIRAVEDYSTEEI